MADVRLVAGDAVFYVDTLGAGMRALQVGGWEVLDGYEAGQPHSGRRGHVLAPWPSRIFRGRYHWDGTDHELPVTDVAHDSATHGLVDKIEWTVDRAERGVAELSVGVPPAPGYPFDVRVSVGYELFEDRLVVRLAADNLGGEPAPFGIGMHPYFRCGADVDETRLDLATRERLTLDHDGRPTGELEAFDGALGEIGERSLDLVLRRDESRDGASAEVGGPAGSIRLGLGPSFRWLVVFTGDSLPTGQRRRSVAVEPLTCPPNAFASGRDVIRLDPGQRWSDQWSVTWSPRR